MRLSLSLSIQTVLVSACVIFSPMVAAAQVTSPPARVTEAVDVEKFVTLPGNTHPLARPEYDRGSAPDSLPIERMLLVLRRGAQQEAALRHLLDQQQIKSSPNYHKWLTPEQFGEQFGPADSDIQAVTEWLTTQGFQVKHVAVGLTVIEFSGTAALVRQALHTQIHKYVVNSQEYWANASDPAIPAALVPVVAGFASLNNFPRRPMTRRLGTFSRSKATGQVRPLFTFTVSEGTYYAVGPYDFATIYNVQPLWKAGIDGTGQTVAIVGQSDINPQDVADFRTMFGLPANAPNIIYNGPNPGILAASGDEGESDLDVEWEGAVAKNATIDFVVSETTEVTNGTDLSALYIIDNNLAPVLASSYGACEGALGTGGNTFYSTIWEQAAAQGITVVVAAGDSGSAECDLSSVENAAQYGLEVTGNASTPFNVGVGGLDFNDFTSFSTYWNSTNTSTTQSSALSYIPETTWNDSCAQTGQTPCTTSVASDGSDLVGGGGGPSSCVEGSYGDCTGAYAKPAWQTGTGVPNDGVRDTPDVSLFAGDGTYGSFYVFCEIDANAAVGGSATSCDLNSPYTDFQGAGGTSASAQVFGGIMALVNQKTGERQGNANYVLYPLAAKTGASCASNTAAVSNSSCIFYDTITGNDSVACDAGSPNCGSTDSNPYGIIVNPSNTSQPAWTTTAGYDLATGLGSVNAANLVNNWTSVSFAQSATTINSISPNPAVHGTDVSVSISVTSPSGTPTGDVSLVGVPSSTSPGSGIDFNTLSNGTVSWSTIYLPGGTYNVQAHYAGDGTFGASDSSPVQVTVTPETTLTDFEMVTVNSQGTATYGATSVTYGTPYLLRVDVTNSSNTTCYSSTTGLIAYPCPTGTVLWTDNGAVPVGEDEGAPSNSTPGTLTLNSQGNAEDWFIQLPGGQHVLVANYGGDNGYTKSSGTATISVTQAATTTTVTSFQSSTATTLTATINTSSSGLGPTGTVQFYNGTTALGSPVTVTPTAGSATTNASSTAVLTPNLTATATITAVYSGDTNYTGSTSPPITVTVTANFSLTTNVTSTSPVVISAPGGSGTATITVTPAFGFTGAVSLTCVVPAAMSLSTCSLNPTSITTSGSTTLTVSTTAPTAAPGPFTFNRPRWIVPGGGAILAFLFLLFMATKRRRLKLAFGLMCLALLAATLVACGGSSSAPPPPTSPGTPTGSYTITVTGTSSSLSHTVNVPVVVE